MHTALGLALHQARGLKGMLEPSEAQLELMILDELLVEVPHVQIEVLVPTRMLRADDCGTTLGSQKASLRSLKCVRMHYYLF